MYVCIYFCVIRRRISAETKKISRHLFCFHTNSDSCNYKSAFIRSPNFTVGVFDLAELWETLKRRILSLFIWKVIFFYCTVRGWSDGYYYQKICLLRMTISQLQIKKSCLFLVNF